VLAVGIIASVAKQSRIGTKDSFAVFTP